MNRIICCPENHLPKHIDPNVQYFSMFSSSGQRGIGHVALGLKEAIRRDKLSPSIHAWDFMTIASAVVAADKAILRKNSADGWTRMIDLTVYLVDSSVWSQSRSELEKMLRFLTGDFWILRFHDGGKLPHAIKRPQKRSEDCICLLSGGIDSLVGAIDLTTEGKTPLFISQVVRGDKTAQKKFASILGGQGHHFQWSHNVGNLKASERSTRSRSIIFFAFAALAASGLTSTNIHPVEIIVPENGFISLNVPMGYGRIGSLSTKTTHPVYMNAIQKLWDKVGIPAQLVFPYRDKTKGELLEKCMDQNKLQGLIGESTSCGKYQMYNLTHCGACVPCLVRRAAFLKANFPDNTFKGYIQKDLSKSKSKDLSAVAVSYLRFKEEGIRRFSGGALSFASHIERKQYEEVVSHGMDELGVLLSSHSVI